MAFQTEVEFTLPKGYLAADSVLHRDGVMRLATAADEILPLKDPRVQQNPAYLTIIVLARVIIKLGSLPDINTKIIEGLFASDLNYLQALYERLNGDGEERSEEPSAQAHRQNGDGGRREFGVLGEA
ncbi:Secreted protein [uncultured Defluviicoccus sp.]|uniref:Secreted protein n=1 Tax=metagenome TaxID=256318 RepID=A0A380TA79_9ZZZZ|nr:Secreted protein [uncultured Defluviicoccus sp.]